MFKKMTMYELISKLLYVPFNNDYIVSPQIKKFLTEDVFLTNAMLNLILMKRSKSRFTIMMKKWMILNGI